MTTDAPSLEQAKARLRREAEDHRAQTADGAAAAAAACEQLLRALDVPTGATVSGYWPMRSEIDPRPILLALGARGHPLCLPVVAGKGKPLIFRAWREGDALAVGDFGIRMPADTQDVLVPHLLVVPLLAFDRAGYRLGYGGGFYDRTLSALRAAGAVVAAGLAFAVQEMESVPHNALDARLDWVITEREAIRMRSGAGAGPG